MRLLLDTWLHQLGYHAFPQQLIRWGQDVPRDRPYASELRALLDPEGDVRAAAVFEVAGVPAVCLIEGDPQAQALDTLDAIRSRIWNQGLVSVVLVLGKDALRALPVVPGVRLGNVLPLASQEPLHPYTAEGVQSSALLDAHPDWFAPARRIDRQLLDHLKSAVKALQPHIGDLQDTQYLMAQVLFVSYLEHRGIVHDAYRRKFDVGKFDELIAAHNGKDLDRLFVQLKEHFNGDFLSPQRKAPWAHLADEAFDVLSAFLKRTDLESQQQDFWPYDFRFIPVELLSGIYESFIGEKAAEIGAFYTPRHLSNLAVDEALAGLAPGTEPVVFDGACGSGILLTTIFRRLLGRAEASAGRTLSLRERSDLLQKTIYGADINVSACRVTAFSLYLSVLEDLVPHDIAELMRKKHDKLPTLIGTNIFAGTQGDMFGRRHPILIGAMPRPTIMLSNPPWLEPAKLAKPTFEKWLANPDVKSRAHKIPLRQIAIAFTYRATELAPGAKLCLILPASAFVKPQARVFVEDWLQKVKLERLINFSDMRSLLFKANHACVIALAEACLPGQTVPPDHLVEYLTPKADLSLAYRRLVIHASDRHLLPQNRLRNSPMILQRLYWGSDVEVGLVERLCGRGTIKGLIDAGRFVDGKGFHVTDGQKNASLAPFKGQPFLDANRVPGQGPVLHGESLQRFSLKKIASHGDMRLYEGARVVFTDGMTNRRRIRACVGRDVFSFNNSLGAIRDLHNDASLMAFLATYLCSDLAAYLALLTAPTAVLERTQIKLAEVTALPFWLPERHPDPERAKAIVAEVADYVIAIEAEAEQWLRPAPVEGRLEPRVEALIREYFGVDDRLGRIVDETMTHVMPHVQPSTTARFPTPLQRAPTDEQLEIYAQTLSTELERYRDRQGGTGRLRASTRVWSIGGVRYGLVLAVAGSSEAIARDVFDAAIGEVLGQLDRHALLQATRGGTTTAADVLIRSGNTLVFAKPLINRLWLTSAALNDALRLVRYVTEGSR